MEATTESSRIYVKNLPPNITDSDFGKHFSKWPVTDIKLLPQRRIGYVGYRSPEEAKQAVKYYNRSYIRMSKLTVELAKSISDPSLAKRKEPWVKAPVAAPVPKPETKPDDGAKKRKRNALVDPKLQEYLAVMQSAKPTLASFDENPVEDDEPPAKVAAVMAGGKQSDDEYESVPSRQSRTAPAQSTRQEGREAVAKAASGIVPHADAAASSEAQGHVPNAADTADTAASDAPAVPAVDATDDDWLRSRQNRLLDLVEDVDEIDMARKPGPLAKDGEVKHAPLEADPHVQQEIQQEVQRQDQQVQHVQHDQQVPTTAEPQSDHDKMVESILRTSRLFVRNLAYTATEEDIRKLASKYGPPTEVHIPMSEGHNKGFAFISFRDAEAAVKCYLECDRTVFQGRIMHVLGASAKRDHTLDEMALSKLPLKQQKLIRQKANAATSKFNWNSLFMSQDAVNDSVADRLGVSKSELLDPTNADAAVKQAIAETSILQDTKAYFLANGVDLESFKSQQRGDLTILCKNFPYGTTVEEIRVLFEQFGKVRKVLLPPSGTIAIVQFIEENEAKKAFKQLGYTRFKNSILFLEKAPKNLLVSDGQQGAAPAATSGVSKLSAADLLERDDDPDEAESSALFVKNLSFATSTEQLASHFQHLEGFKSARIKTKTDPKKPGQVLSQGYGFVEFASKPTAEAALAGMNGSELHGHKLQIKASHRGNDAAEERRKGDKAKKVAEMRTKLIVKNLPFEANKAEVRKLLGTYGHLRSIRLPKNINNRGKGFAFAEFVTAKEALNAMNALSNTHLLGRRLVVQFAESDAVDPEEEIASMMRKVGGQTHKVALQQLTGAGRKRVTLGDDDDEGE